MRVLRLIDANLNRAAEGLRVIEDCLRFYWDDAGCSECVKSIRHRLQEVFASVSAVSRLRARDTDGDVGTIVTAAGEYQRDGVVGVLRANLERVKQSLRVLEEASKTIEQSTSHDRVRPAAIESIRYEFYSLEKSLACYLPGQIDWSDRNLYVLVDGGQDDSMFERWVDELVRAGVDLIQLRDKHLPDRELVERARVLVRRTRGTRTLAIINDRPDVARIVEADGVHVGQEELSVYDCRRVLTAQAIVGVSTHSVSQIQEASQAGADYLGVGPVFSSRTKHFDATAGLELVQAAAEMVSIPWFAIGGIDGQSLSTVLHAGARRVAVASGIMQAQDRHAAARSLKACLLEHSAQGANSGGQ